MNLAKRTVTGVAWAYTVFVGGRLATLLTTAILARILFPADFGLVGFAILFLNFIEATRDFGVKDALIYSDERLRDTADTAFWMNVLIGAFQYLLAVLLAPLALNFIDDSRIVLMLRVMSLSFIINAVGNTHDGLLQKNLKHRRRYLPSLYSAIIKGIVSTILALAGAGVWSLVVGHVVGASVKTIAKWLLIDWVPRLRFYMDRANALWRYGVYILAFNLLGVALDQADQLMIGTLLGEVELGYFSIASRIPEMVIANFSLVLTTILFPTFSKIKHDRSMLTQSFLLTTKYTGFFTIPAGFGLAAIAPELIMVFFGSQWEPAIRLLQVLAFLGLLTTLPWTVGDVFKAIGRPDISTKLLVVEAAYTFPLVWFFTYHFRQAVWTSFANVIAIGIAAVLRLGLSTRYLPVKPTAFLTLFRAPFFAGMVMFGVVTFWRQVVETLPAFPVLISSIVIGAVVYAVLMWWLEREELVNARDFMRDMIRSRGEDDLDEVEFDDMPTAVPGD